MHDAIDARDKAPQSKPLSRVSVSAWRCGNCGAVTPVRNSAKRQRTFEAHLVAGVLMSDANPMAPVTIAFFASSIGGRPEFGL
jgi:hypothetical protein